MKTYILGMAKSPLQLKKGQFNGIADEFAKPLKPGSARSLELDFLRLVYAKKELSSKGHVVHAYLMVTTEEVVNAVDKWRKKYELEENYINILHASLNEDEIRELLAEKIKNKTANGLKEKKKAKKEEAKKEEAKADFGRDTIEGKLISHIKGIHGNIEVVTAIKSMPFGVNWDYFGMV